MQIFLQCRWIVTAVQGLWPRYKYTEDISITVWDIHQMVSLGLLLIPLLDKITFSVRHLDVYITSLSNHPTNACAGSPISLTYYYLFIHFWFLLCWWKLISTVLTMLTCLVWGYHQNYPNWIIRDLDPADEQLCALQSGGWLHPFPTYINPACFCQVPGCYYACKNCAIIDQDS